MNITSYENGGLCFYFYSYYFALLRLSLMYPRLALNSLGNLGWLWTSGAFALPP